MKRIGLVERSGRGVDIIFEGALRYGRRPPEYTHSTSTSVHVVMPLGHADVPFMRLIFEAERTLGSAIPFDSLVALSQVRRERRCDVRQIGRAIQRSESEARAVVERLVEAGLLEGRGEKSGRVYILSKQVYLATDGGDGYVKQRGLDATEQRERVLAHVDAHGVIRRSDAAALCGVSDDQATRLLRRLVKAGDLVQLGERRGALAGERPIVRNNPAHSDMRARISYARARRHR